MIYFNILLWFGMLVTIGSKIRLQRQQYIYIRDTCNVNPKGNKVSVRLLSKQELLQRVWSCCVRSDMFESNNDDRNIIRGMMRKRVF